MKIEKVLFVPGIGGNYYMDINAVRAGAQKDGFTYRGEPVGEGFSRIVQPGESLSVMLITDTGEVAFGDCAAIILSSSGGRPKPFLAADYVSFLKNNIESKLVGRELSSYKKIAEDFDKITAEDGSPLHPAVNYGISQALLDGVAKAKRITMTEVLAEEFDLTPSTKPVSILSSCPPESIYDSVDKSIIKSVDVFPHHGIITLELLGAKGEKLLDFVKWMNKRVKEIGEEGYNPSFHIDVYGTIGVAFEYDVNAMADYLGKLEEAAKPYKLYIETFVQMETREKQIEMFSNVRRLLEKKGINVVLIVDEWCNSLDDVKAFLDADAIKMAQVKMPLYGGVHNGLKALWMCKQKGVKVCIGGSCNETIKSVQVTVHIALAGNADWILARPGLGVDEGIMVVHNEMARTLALMAMK